MVKRFQESITAAAKERPGKPRTARCEERFQRVTIDVQENPQTFCTFRTTYWITTPYHESLETSSIQNSTDTGVTNRRPSEKVRLGTYISCSSQAMISFRGWLCPTRRIFTSQNNVNKQNSRYWSADNPRIIHEHPLNNSRT